MRRSRENDRRRLNHMLDAAINACNFAHGKSRDEFYKDLQLQYAVAHAVQIVGEAASKVTSEGRAELSDIPWKDIIGMRQVLVHAYFKAEVDILWDTVLVKLPPLIVQLETILASEDSSE